MTLLAKTLNPVCGMKLTVACATLRRSPTETQTDSLNEPPKHCISWSRTAKRSASSFVLPRRTKEDERGDLSADAVRRALPRLLPALSSCFASFGYQVSWGG